jgi:hypothetical protein
MKKAKGGAGDHELDMDVPADATAEDIEWLKKNKAAADMLSLQSKSGKDKSKLSGAIHTQTPTHTHPHTHLHTYTHPQRHTHTHTHTHTCIHIYIYTHSSIWRGYGQRSSERRR